MDDKNITGNNGFGDEDFIIGKGFEISEEPVPAAEEKHSKHKHSGGKSVIKTLIWIICIIVVSVGLAFGVIYAGADYMGIGFGRGEDCVLEIEKGMPAVKIASQLKECGAVKIPVLFRVYAKLKHYDSQFKYGVYTFNNEAGYEALSKMLIEEGSSAESVRVTIPEMSTVDDIAKILEEKSVCTKSDFIEEVQHGKFDYDFVKAIPQEKVYYRLEGYLFPETYDFYSYESKECAHLAVDKMLKTLNDKLSSSLREKISKSGYTFNEIITLSSLVELEAGGAPEEMANVAAVFCNRLNNKAEYPKLQSSPTQKYPYGSGKYDTYKSDGLPPGPLCSPSFNSIKAAIDPSTDYEGYYYFVTDAKMKFYYNKTLGEHNATIARLKKENNWIGDR